MTGRRALRVLLATGERVHGGAESFTVRVAGSLAERGHHVSCAGRTGSWIERAVAGTGVPFLPVAPRGSVSFVAAIRLARRLRTGQFELIHAHKAKEYMPVVIAARLAGCKVVLSRHDLFPMSQYAALAASHADRILAVSNIVRDALLATTHLPGDLVHTLYPGIKLDGYRPLDGARQALPTLNILPESPVIGMVNRLVSAKRIDTFIRAAALVKETHPRVRFLVVGDGPERQALQDLANSLGLSDGLQLTGFVDDSVALLREFDAFVAGGESEAFSYSIQEAMACKIPVIAAQGGGNLEAISDGQTGVFFTPRDERSLANAMRRILDRPEDAQEMGIAGRKRVEVSFTLDGMLDRLEEVYYNLLER